MIDKPINEAITDKQVLVLEENGTKLGILNTKEAIEKAKKEKKDLVLISKSENPKIISVAKIIEYKKFLYIQKKKEKENKNNFSVTKVKVVKITPHINDHDLHWRSGQTIDWLNSGHQVKLRIQTYGRVGEKADVINAMYEKFFGLISKSAKIQVPLKKLSPVLHEAIFVKTKS